jgi:uncharacterized membrane-anchored protein YjiN (DUF445 family)
MQRLASNRVALGRIKQWATLLLLAVALLYIISRLLEPQHPVLAWVSAFAEAAMVGALADWFAVVALFKHPMGLPIPHTAIIPKNKQRVADNLGRFITSNFLGTDTILARITEFNPALHLAIALSRVHVAENIGGLTAKGIAFWLNALEDDRVQRFLHETLKTRLETMDVARLAGNLLDFLTYDDRHQQLLDKCITMVRVLLRHKSTREELADRIESQLNWFLKTVNFSNVIGKFAAKKLVSGAMKFLSEVDKDKHHEMRIRFDEFVRNFIAKLKADEKFHAQGVQIRDELLKRPEIADYVKGLWQQLRSWLRSDLQRTDSTIKAHVTNAVLDLGRNLAADTDIQSWINEQILGFAKPFVEKNREKVAVFIAGQVRAWDDQQLVYQLELNIGRDLQFIRINGTLVGGLIGILIFGFTKFIIV